MKRFKLTIKDIAEIAMLVSLAVLLDRDGLKIRLGAQSGSISLTMVPLFVLALRHGLIKSFIGIGIIYGLLTNLLDGYGFITYPLDYLLAYGSLSLLSLFRPVLYRKYKHWIFNYLWLTLAIVSAVTIRLVFHVISGIVIYETNFIGSLTYNASFVILPPLAVTLPVMWMLWEPLKRINARFPIQDQMSIL
ncbi:MAG: energy-coupled thiamine transporter ThiT [Bacteroidales bacterium]|jgi:thiamine transporter|nr:energy-coupled thiamine transporter ThiT [Bacteroidales bacterium]